MALLDGILGNVLGSVLGGGQGQQQNPLSTILSGLGGNASKGNLLLSLAMTMLQKNGGLGGVVDLFRRSGLAQQADSWVSTGPNQAISADQLQQVFGSAALGNVAAQLGMSPAQTNSAFAQLLPELINQLTPQGQVPENQDDLISQGLAMLQRGLR